MKSELESCMDCEACQNYPWYTPCDLCKDRCITCEHGRKHHSKEEFKL